MFDIGSFNEYLSIRKIPQDLITHTIENLMLPKKPLFTAFTVLSHEETLKVENNQRVVQVLPIGYTGHNLIFLRTIRKDHKPLGACPVVPLQTWVDLL